MRVLMTGGSGFLGRALTERLLAGDAGVTWLSRTPSGLGRVPPAVDVRGYGDLGAGDRFDVVVNLAGAGIADRRWSEGRKQVLLESRLGPTRKLLEWMAGAGHRPRLLLSGSATGWYGNQGDAPLDERSGFHDEFAHELCARWEAAALQAETLGVATVLLRTGVVLHPDGGMLGRLSLPFRLGLGGRLGDGRQYLSWIAREDWVEAVRFLIARHPLTDGGLHGPFNLTAPAPVTNAEFTREFARELRRPAPLPVPATALRLALGEMATLLLDGQRVLPRGLLQLGFGFRCPRIGEALSAV